MPDDILEGNCISETSAVDLKRARDVVAAAFLGWTLGAFDFFILILTLDNVSQAFGFNIASVAFSITLTLATRAIGAFIFGRLGVRVVAGGVSIQRFAGHAVVRFRDATVGLAWHVLRRRATRVAGAVYRHQD
jgi:SHS family lactate transporter-like MFS transporter